MKLNIHLISHPIVQNLSSITINQKLSTYTTQQAFKQIGLFIVYETLRNWLKFYPLTIKNIGYKKELIIVDPKESYIAIFNNIKYLSLIQEIQLLLPKIELKLIHKNDIKIENKNLIQISNNNLYTKIIIICYEIELEYIINLLKYLVDNKKININQIRLICIKCETSQLINISKYHSNLNIYTTKIINN